MTLALRRASALVLTVALGTTLTALLAPAPAVAAPHYLRPGTVQVGYTDSADRHRAFDRTDDVDLPLGSWRDDRGRRHTSRVYATFDLTPLLGKRVHGGSVYIQETSAADCSRRAIEIWRTRTISRTPSWATAPERVRKLDEVLTTSFCPGQVGLDVGDAVIEALARGRTSVSFEIRVPERFEDKLSYGRTIDWYTGVVLSVSYNSPPTIVAEHRYTGGFPCDDTAPYRVLAGFAGWLQALAADADADDSGRLRHEFEVWPTADPAAVATYVSEFGSPTRVATATVPAGALVDGTTYSWRVRVGDGADVSDWSSACSFTVDRSRPPAPAVSSPNIPPDGQAPIGERPVFVLDGGGDPDVAGFEYTWSSPSTPGCSYGSLGQLECDEPFTAPNTVRADAPGGTATVPLDPPSIGRQQLRVRSVDAAGNRSLTDGRYEFFVSREGSPTITVVGNEPAFGRDITLRIDAHPDVPPAVEYEYYLDQGAPQVVPADPDGSITITIPADDAEIHDLQVRSRSANGWLSPPASWQTDYLPWPTVRSDDYPEFDGPHGGVGVPGDFTFLPPTRYPDVEGYRYSFDFGVTWTDVPASPDGHATVTWTPEVSGETYMEVYPLYPGGTQGDYSAIYYFAVA